MVLKADIDDEEAAKFVEAVASQNRLRYLDMISNLLGSHETFRQVKGAPDDKVSNIEVNPFAQMLQNQKCRLVIVMHSYIIILLKIYY